MPSFEETFQMTFRMFSCVLRELDAFWLTEYNVNNGHPEIFWIRRAVLLKFSRLTCDWLKISGPTTVLPLAQDSTSFFYPSPPPPPTSTLARRAFLKTSVLLPKTPNTCGRNAKMEEKASVFGFQISEVSGYVWTGPKRRAYIKPQIKYCWQKQTAKEWHVSSWICLIMSWWPNPNTCWSSSYMT